MHMVAESSNRKTKQSGTGGNTCVNADRQKVTIPYSQTHQKREKEDQAMMQTLTKNELALICNALGNEVDRCNEVMEEAKTGSDALSAFAGHIAECRRDALRGIMHKINATMNDGCKRIKID